MEKSVTTATSAFVVLACSTDPLYDAPVWPDKKCVIEAATVKSSGYLRLPNRSRVEGVTISLSPSQTYRNRKPNRTRHLAS
jgi:hypothetical protein